MEEEVVKMESEMHLERKKFRKILISDEDINQVVGDADPATETEINEMRNNV